MESEVFASYRDGARLYGDDLNAEQIAQWYEDEQEGYANLGAADRESYQYVYHALNRHHGFRFLPHRRFHDVLGFGSAYGHEFRPLLDRIDRLTIVDPSAAFSSTELDGIPVSYRRPQTSGILDFENNSFDLITCLGVLHHVPNVTFVVRELYRCLRPEGFALLREPIVSMGDWTKPRPGLTRHERGIPLPLFRSAIRDAGFRIVAENLCVFRPLTILWSRLFGAPYNSSAATRLDAVLSRMFHWNWTYHTDSHLGKFRPSAAYFVLSKDGVGTP